MAIPVNDLRNAAAMRRVRAGHHPLNACERGPLPLADPDNSPQVAIDHEQHEFVTLAEAEARGAAVSLFPVGKDCYRRIKKALAEPPAAPQGQPELERALDTLLNPKPAAPRPSGHRRARLLRLMEEARGALLALADEATCQHETPLAQMALATRRELHEEEIAMRKHLEEQG